MVVGASCAPQRCLIKIASGRGSALRKKLRAEYGGMAVEAALIMPFFLVFILLLISFMTIGMADAALSAAVSETAKQAAAHLYPIALAAEEVSSGKVGQTLGSLLENMQMFNELILENGSDADSLLYLPAEEMWRDLAESVAVKWLTPLVLKNADRGILRGQDDRLRIVKVTLPDLRDKANAYFGIEAEYTVTLPIPFFRKAIVLKKRAYERAWIGW